MKLRNHYFILRHGQTTFQAKKKKFIYPSPENPPVPLTEKGEKQIETAAQKLKGKKIKAIYSSDFFRTRQTAGIVAKELGLKVKLDKRLRDLNLGIYHGKTKEEFYRELPKNSMKRFSQRPKEGESWQDVEERMRNFIKEIDKRHKNENILIISHGDPLWLIKGVVKGLTEEKLLKDREKIYPKTGELKILNP